MGKETKENEVLQWHPAFYAGLQIEFEKESDKLIFENEHQLGTKPKEIDVLIIKKNDAVVVEKNLGRLFRKHNIIEYKSPVDYISIDDFYKVYGYACFYKSDVVNVNEILIEDITISFMCYKFPRKLVKHLQKVQKFHIQQVEKGIYYILGDIIPMQIVILNELSKQENFWLSNLTNHIINHKCAQEILDEYQEHSNNILYQSVMNVIVHANRSKFREVTGMCDALMELLSEMAEEKAIEMVEEKAEKLAEEKAEKLAEEKAEKLAEEKAEKLAEEKAEKLAEEKAEKLAEEKAEKLAEEKAEKKMIELINNWIKKGKTYDEIADLLDLSKEKIVELAQ